MPSVSPAESTAASGQLTGEAELRDIVQAFPAGVVHSFGYGSGVFQQQLEQKNASSNDLPMLDLILVVEDAKEWHEANLRQHPHHYSTSCRILGSNFCAGLQRNFGARVFFHALVETPNHSERLIKYGVVQIEDLKRDLQNWDFLYLAGRMHKPTVLITKDEELLEVQQEQNLPYALAASLLLSEPFDDQSNSIISLEHLYEKIANLSYAGDIRMEVGGEDPDKVLKLVHSPGQFERFQELYRHPLQQLEKEGILSVSDKHVDWDSTKSARKALWSRLPQRLATLGESNETLSSIQLQQALAAIVAPAARYQSLKGILTAGVARSIRYAGAKFAKGAFRNF